MPKLQLHFQRYEFKYVISKQLEAKIKERIGSYLDSDPFAAALPGQQYEVVSLYFDSPRFYYYQQKVDGVQRRKKIRLRTYYHDGQFNPHIFFEIKRKYDAVILKDRFVISPEAYRELIREGKFTAAKVERDQNQKNIIEEFERERQLRFLTPKLILRYEREPYLGKFNRNVRLTFDRGLRAMENDDLWYEGGDWTEVLPGMTVMELKFNGTLPFYVRDTIQEFNLERVSYSKYCQAVDACGSLSAAFLSRPAGLRRVNEELESTSGIII